MCFYTGHGFNSIGNMPVDFFFTGLRENQGHTVFKHTSVYGVNTVIYDFDGMDLAH